MVEMWQQVLFNQTLQNLENQDILRPLMSAESPSTPQKSYPKFRNPLTTFEIFQKEPLKKHKTPQGARGGLRIWWGVNISSFCQNKTLVKFQNSN
jgi:hypothetical protein